MQDFTRMVEEAVRRGQLAANALSIPAIDEFFERKTLSYVDMLLNPETEMEAIATAVARIRVLQDLHDTLTQAVRDGLTAAERLSQQAKGDSR